MTAPIAKPAARRGAKAYATAIAIAQVCALVRYIVLARILGPQELGWAVMIVLTGQFFDSISESGSDKFLIQDARGDERPAQRLVQLTALCRGFIIAALLLLAAGPIAHFLEAPTIEPGLRLLALAPLIGGFINVDLRRMQRHHDFRIEGRATLLAEVLSLAVTAGVALATRSYLAIVYGLITRAIVLVAVSNLMASRRYSAWFSREFARRLALFGVPLLFNGLLLFAGSQGDRIVISKLLGAAELGRYSAAMLLIFYPTAVVQRYIANLFLPQITRHDPRRLANVDAMGGLVLVIASAATVGFALVAPFAMPLLFGHQFAQLPLIIALVGVLNTARFLKLWPINILLADGRSHWVLTVNLLRLVAVPLALIGSLWHGSLTMIVLAFIAGELVSFVAAMWFAGGALDGRYRDLVVRLALFTLLCLAVSIGAAAVEGKAWTTLGIAAVVSAALCGFMARRERRAIDALLSIVRRRPAAAPAVTTP